jgi:quercetin 2,3-dioxygenase
VKPREVQRIAYATRLREGAGFEVRRAFPLPGLDQVDPFLLLDEMGPTDYPAGEAVGAPDHPHRGFETVTYVLAGEYVHEDSAGHRGSLQPGDVQWMTAGDGVIHSEQPSAKIKNEGGRVHGFQLWVNLPARDKRIAPRYQDVRAEAMPTWRSDDGRAQVKVIAGSVLGVQARAETRSPITFVDVALEPGAEVTLDIPEAQNAFVYVFHGSMTVGALGRTARDGDMAMLTRGDALPLRGKSPRSRALVIAGEPLDEPVVRHGPFVMNTVEEVQEAIADFQAGRFGQIAR